MKIFRIKIRELVGLSLCLLVMVTSPSVFAESQATVNPSDEGISSYLFSPRAVTVLLVLILIAQLVYRHRMKNATVSTQNISKLSASGSQSSFTKAKRYDRDEISKLLKASASSTNSGRSLEEAIRMSQEAQATLMETMDGHHYSDENIAPGIESKSQTISAEPHSSNAE